MTDLSYAIVPDGRDEPVAIFADLEDAIAWALGRLGGGRFVVRGIDLVALERPPRPPRPSA